MVLRSILKDDAPSNIELKKEKTPIESQYYITVGFKNDERLLHIPNGGYIPLASTMRSKTINFFTVKKCGTKIPVKR